MILSAHALAGAALAIALPTGAGALAALLVLALGFATARDRAWLAGGRALRAIEILSGDRVTLETADGLRREVEVAPRRIVHRLFVSIPVHATMRRTILVTADMLGEQGHRALRLWALWGRLPGASMPTRRA